MQQQNYTVQDILNIVRRRKWAFMLPAGLLLALAVTLALVLPPVYQSSSTILIEEQEIPRDYVLTTVTGFVEQRLQTITQRIMTTTRLLEIINQHGLYADKRQKWNSEETVDQMRKDINFETISSDVIDPRTGRASEATVAFRLSYRSRNPRVAQQIANVLTSLYLEENLKVRQQQTEGASQFLEQEMESLKKSLKESDRKISTFKEQHLDNLPELVNFNMQSLERTERDLEQLQIQLRMLKDREVYLQSQLVIMPADEKDLDRQRLAELRLQLTNLLTRVSEAYPDVPKLKAEIAEIERRLEPLAGKFGAMPSNPEYVNLKMQLANIRSEISSIKDQTQALSAKRDDLQRRIAGAPRVEEGYTVLLAERNNIQTKFNEISAKYMEARVAQGLEQDQMGERFTLIEAAQVPERPVSPNRPAIGLIGLILGLGAGTGLLCLLEFSDQSVRTSEELARVLPLPVLAGIPDIITAGQLATTRRQRVLVQAGLVVMLFGSVAAFHFFVMDLDIFWAKLGRRLPL